MIGFVIGNGESRIGYDLTKLKKHGPVYGCNALYRDFLPDALFAVDERMINEILAKGDIGTEFIYRQKYKDTTLYLKSSKSNEEYRDKGYAAGPTALSVLCTRFKNLTEVFLLGFDIYSNTGKINNVYKDTSCYAPSERTPVYPVNWIEKLARIFVANEHITFYRLYADTLIKVPEWLDIDNIRYITYKELDTILSRD